MNNNTNTNNFNTPRVQLSCSLCTYKTFSQDILDDHMDSQHKGTLEEITYIFRRCLNSGSITHNSRRVVVYKTLTE